MSWQSTPYLFPLLASGFLAVLMAFLAWQRRYARTGKTVTVLMIGVALWCFFGAAEVSSTSIRMWTFWNTFTYLGIVTIPAAWLIYVLQVVSKDEWLNKRRLLLFCIEPLLTFIAIITNSSHHLFHEVVWLNFRGGITYFNTLHGPFFWVHAVYSYILILLATLLLIYALIRQSAAFKGQTIVLLVGAAAPWVGNIAFLFGFSPWPNLDLTPFLFLISGAALLYGLFRFQLLEISPMARDRLIEVMSDALVVLDTRGLVIDLNPAFERLFEIPAEQAFGRPAKELLERLHISVEFAAGNIADGDNLLHVPPGEGCQEAYYDIKVNPLYSRKGQVIGKLVMVRDITERKWIEQENLRLYQAEHEQRELAEAMRQAGEVLTATLDFNTVLDRLLEQIARLVPYDSANVILINEGKAQIIRARGYEKFSVDVDAHLLPFSFELQNTANLRFMNENEKPLIIPDTHIDPHWIDLPVTRYIRSWLGAPLIVRDQVIGFFSLDKVEVDFYRPEHARRLFAFAGQAALALENSHLFEEMTVSLGREQRLNDVTRTIASSLNLDEVLSSVVHKACELVGADAGILALYNPQSDTMSAPYIYNYQPTDDLSNIEREGLTWFIHESGESLLLDNYRDHPAARPQFADTGVKAFLGIPVRAGDERLGVLSLFLTREGVKFKSRDADLIEAVARQAGIAIQNARLFRAAQKRAEEAETLREATAAVASALDLDQVLNHILVNLEKVVPYDSATIFLLESDFLRIRAGRGFSHVDSVLDVRFPVKNDLFETARDSGKPIVIEDAQFDKRFKRWGDSAHVHGWMGISLTTRGQSIGLLTVDSRQIGAYTETDAKLALAFANEAATAIENARLFSEVQRLAITDPLTGLYNRRHFFETARREVERTRRYGGVTSVIMMDVDNLKLVNDRYGHLAGDHLVEMVARKCREVLRTVDVIGRYAGDEFIILLPETDLENAVEAAQRVRLAISSTPIEVGEEMFFSSLSIGLAELTEDCVSLEMVIERADRALYASKRAGKNQVTAWQPEQFSFQKGDGQQL